MRAKQWLKLVIWCGVLVVGVGRVAVDAQSDSVPPPLTWDDSPPTPILRHEADAQVRLGNFTANEALGPFLAPPFSVGDETIFNIATADDPQRFELYYRSEFAYFWFPPDIDIDMAALEQAAIRFDTEIYPTNRNLFGDALMLGVDGDPRIHLVHLESLFPGLAGFFSPEDTCARRICPRSNQRDVLYLMLDYGPLNSDLYLSTIAHEFQHMLQFSLDGNEYRWLDEGYSQLAEHLQGFTADPINLGNVEQYLMNTNMLLNSWSDDFNVQGQYYGAGYLLAVYLEERFGSEFVFRLSHGRADGLAGIHRILTDFGYNITLDELMTDWWVANYFDDPALADGRYGYNTLVLPDVTTTMLFSEGMIIYDGLLHPYGVEYLRLDTPGTYVLTFQADSTTPLITRTMPRGETSWWSYNATATATTLTRTIDLTEVESATMKYWVVGQTGNFGGHLHVLASTDGVTWDVLLGNNMDVLNRFTNAPGPHYTNTDGMWIADFIDISAYAGGTVDIRFEYVTNNALAGPGFMLDDFAIPEIGWTDNVEDGAVGWHAEGFIRTDGTVQQNWAVVVLDENNPQPAQIIPIEAGSGGVTIEIPAGGATIMVGSLAPITHLPATYQLILEPTP